MSTYHTSTVAIRGDADLSPGLATVHEARVTGHVTIYLPGDGYLSVSADTPEMLRALSEAFANAASELEAELVSA